MFAAHCGSVGTQWVHPVPSATVPGNYLAGNTVLRDIYRDGAIIEGAYYEGGVWWGPYNSSAAFLLTGTATPVANASICFSGALSGTVCNNTVTATNVNYNLGGDLSSVTGVMTQNIAGIPAVGNGDSGGPGVIPVSYNGSTYISASTIISAIPQGSSSTCTGTPGDAQRKCSATAYSTVAGDIARFNDRQIIYYQR